MCGIVGYIGTRQAAPLIFEGLRRLEYRGYDSAGIAVIEDGQIAVRREVGKLGNLERMLAADPLHGTVGIGHTRWATHGAPSRINAHPHRGMNGDVVVVHNGIVENFQALRQELEAEGVEFKSETDTETIAHLVERYLGAGYDLAEATRRAALHLKGAHAIVTMTRREPERLVAVRIGNAGGVTVGVGDGEMFVASDIPAILEHTRRVAFLESRELAVVDREGFQVHTLDGRPVNKEIQTIQWDPVAALKGEYKHFMQKEIFEQVRAITDTLGGRVDFERGHVEIDTLALTEAEARALGRIVIVGMGTALNAGLIGRYMIERLARVVVDVDNASEFRYREPVVQKDSVVLAISQSGETADTLAALEEGRRQGATLWSIVNAIGSQAMRVAAGTIAMQAGPEIGVASTKAFTTSLVDLYLLGLLLGERRGALSGAALRAAVAGLAALPDQVGRALDMSRVVKRLADRLAHYQNFLYLGRGINYPVALEGALKLKEISYIHAEGYPAGEMKHGPIALLDENMPVVALATQDSVYDKMISQIEQAKARGAPVIAVATEGDEQIAGKADHVLYVPATPELLSPVVNVIPLQLLAYHIAVRRGADVDQPRNLAKSVTVE
jgi:glucosamine--fructose-6-phosphate aminotransferase (isomerizing)